MEDIMSLIVTSVSGVVFVYMVVQFGTSLICTCKGDHGRQLSLCLGVLNFQLLPVPTVDN